MIDMGCECWTCGALFPKLGPCPQCGSERVDMRLSGPRMIDHFDRQGNAISLWEYVLLCDRDRDYRRVAETPVGEIAWVSTVWLGLNTNWMPDGPPLIFETMVFTKPVPTDEELMAPDMARWATRPLLRSLEDIFGTRRYATEEEALAGHADTVAEVEAWVAEQRAWIEVAVADIQGEQE